MLPWLQVGVQGKSSVCVGTVLPSSVCPGTGSTSARGCCCANRHSGEGWVRTSFCWLGWAVCSSGLSWTGSCTFRHRGYTWLPRNWLLQLVCVCWGQDQTLAQELVPCPRDSRARWWQRWQGTRQPSPAWPGRAREGTGLACITMGRL